MGTYPPRECGIATFNQDLLKAGQKYIGDKISCKVAALNLTSVETYKYPHEVRWKIDQNNKTEYSDLAKKFNNDPLITGIIIQHEYGIYGGADGENVLDFIEECKKPIIVTFHTVLPNPSENMKQVTGKIIRGAKVLVVLTESSKTILETVYPDAVGKVHTIPHGIHATNFEDTTKAKKRLRLQNTTILSTFGLLSRGKGIEYVISSLPEVVKKHPTILYLVLGKTHPVVRRDEGESYRKELEGLVTKLNLKNHVKFYDQYLSLTDLIEFLKATDIYVSTSINPNQSVSGTLSYALGTGRAVVSTEFAQAKEIVTPDTGRLVPIMNADAYTNAFVELLKDQISLKNMHNSAYETTRPMLWSNVASKYTKLLTWNILPPVNLKHLRDMTDNFGLFQFANVGVPDKKFGYTIDDNARALIVTSWLHAKNKSNSSKLELYLNFIKTCQLPSGEFINYLDHPDKIATKQNKSENLQDANSRAMWALGEVISNTSIPNTSRNTAKKIFIKALPHVKKFHYVRSMAFLIKSFAAVAKTCPEYKVELTKIIGHYADILVGKLEKKSVKTWEWFDNYLGYSNAVIPESLLIAGDITGRQLYIDKGKLALAFLISKTFSKNTYIPIGHSHWYKNLGKRSLFDQQPEDPASMILALVTAYQITHDESYRNLIYTCFSWFLGNNSLETPLYNLKNGGCYDGLHPDRVNQNQGAESLVSYLLSRLSIEKIVNV